MSAIQWKGADGNPLGTVSNWSQLTCDATYEEEEKGKKYTYDKDDNGKAM